MSDAPHRIMLLTTPQTYRAEAFLLAAKRLGIELIQVIDMPKPLAEQWGMQLAVDFSDTETAVSQLLAYAKEKPVSAIIPVDDAGTKLAALASHALGLSYNSIESAEAARNKLIMRQLLAAQRASSPRFLHLAFSDSAKQILSKIQNQIGFPCVIKPLALNGSRGVMRVNDNVELIVAIKRLERMLTTPTDFLVEAYISGIEVALEGVLDNGRLQPLAIFDKPDPLEGPFFEETLYVTPSRLPQEKQQLIVETAEAGAKAIGLQHGSVHAELRLNDTGVWIVEINGRSIGGLCSQSLRFDMTIADETKDPRQLTLEELLLRQACGFDVTSLRREQSASGVMMIPIPYGGILRGVEGIKEAEAVSLVDEVVITVPLNNRLVPLPEGESYLGFIFASGGKVEAVEAALRQAHAKLSFQIDEEIPLIQI